MSFIDHRCGHCGHLGYQHLPLYGETERTQPCCGVTDNRQCGCTTPDRNTTPEVVPVFAFGGVEPLPVRVPGLIWAPGSGMQYPLCDCSACTELAAAS